MEEEAKAGEETVLRAYRTPLNPVSSFNYLGRVLMAEDGNWAVVLHNLRRVHQKWARLTRVLGDNTSKMARRH